GRGGNLRHFKQHGGMQVDNNVSYPRRHPSLPGRHHATEKSRLASQLRGEDGPGRTEMASGRGGETRPEAGSLLHGLQESFQAAWKSSSSQISLSSSQSPSSSSSSASASQPASPCANSSSMTPCTKLVSSRFPDVISRPNQIARRASSTERMGLEIT